MDNRIDIPVTSINRLSNGGRRGWKESVRLEVYASSESADESNAYLDTTSC